MRLPGRPSSVHESGGGASPPAGEVREKRGGGLEVVPLDVETAEEAFRHDEAAQMPQEALFDRKWAKAVLARVLKALEGALASVSNRSSLSR